MDDINATPCLRCGHARASHYNTRSKYKGGQPCHHLGAHDMRCSCKEYKMTPRTIIPKETSSQIVRRLAKTMRYIVVLPDK